MKWPNDVLLNGGKLAGILLETSGVQGRAGVLSIGVGVNLVASPSAAEVEEGALRPVSVLEETGRQVYALDLLSALARSYAELESQFRMLGFGPIRTAWLAQAARLGEAITARTMRETWQGTFEDVDAEGYLVLRGPRGIERIAAADIYF